MPPPPRGPGKASATSRQTHVHGPHQGPAVTATARPCQRPPPALPPPLWAGCRRRAEPGSGRAWRASVACARSPGGTEHWPAWLPSAAHRMNPQTRRPGWRSAADRREARCHQGSRPGRGEAGVGGGGAPGPTPRTSPLAWAGSQGRPLQLPGRCSECETLTPSISGLLGKPMPPAMEGCTPNLRTIAPFHHLILGGLCTPTSLKVPAISSP